MDNEQKARAWDTLQASVNQLGVVDIQTALRTMMGMYQARIMAEQEAGVSYEQQIRITQIQNRIVGESQIQ